MDVQFQFYVSLIIFFTDMIFTLWDWLVLIITLLGILLGYGFWLNGHFKRRGVKYIENTVPFFGHMLNIILNKDHFEDAVCRVYNTFKNEK